MVLWKKVWKIGPPNGVSRCRSGNIIQKS
jgi:hypothetical protein